MFDVQWKPFISMHIRTVQNKKALLLGELDVYSKRPVMKRERNDWLEHFPECNDLEFDCCLK